MPKYALSAGPVLLKDGKCPFDFTETPKGADYYLSNTRSCLTIFSVSAYRPTARP